MTKSSSRYFRILPCATQGNIVDTVIEQVFPTPAPKPIETEEADKIIRLPDRVIVTRVRNRRESNPGSTWSKKEYVYSNDRLEVAPRQEPAKSFELPGWELREDGAGLVASIEARLGTSGLTIVLERGILERPIERPAEV